MLMLSCGQHVHVGSASASIMSASAPPASPADDAALAREVFAAAVFFFCLAFCDSLSSSRPTRSRFSAPP